jgi:predicted glutamine amidotransferase
MCGLVAMHSAERAGFTNTERDEFKQMLIINSLRGSHSTGIAGVDSRKAGEVSLIKATGSPYSLYAHANTDKFMNKIISEFDNVIGHGRFATKGKIIATNAHPYEEGNIVLAHNGVINNYFSLRDHKRHDYIDVDSHLIAKLFDEEGAENVLPSIEGAYVFIWYDKATQKLNIARNAARPLHVGLLKNRDTLVFASEQETLLWNEARNRTPLKSLEEIPTFQIHSYATGELVPEITEYKQKPVKSYSYGRMGWQNNGYDYDDDLPFEPVKSTYKDTRKSSPLQATNYDEVLLENLVKEATLEVGTVVRFPIEDYDMHPNYAAVWGSSPSFPNVLFRATFNDVTEQEFISADYVEGVVSSMYMLYDGGENLYGSYLTKARLVHEKIDGEAMVEILNINGDPVNISRFRLAEIAEKKCAWCEGELFTSELLNPSELLIHDDDDPKVVCTDCAAGLVSEFKLKPVVH